ncbi:MAG: hypothetical protein WCG95_04355 [bacterium]
MTTELEQFEEANNRREELIELSNDLYNRGEDAKSEIIDLEDEKVKLKSERPALLADNEDVSEINKRLKEIDDEIELNQDIILGVEEKRKNIKHKIFRATEDSNSTFKELVNKKLDEIGPSYVKSATKFVQILKEYITLEMMRDGKGYKFSKFDWRFTKIPNVVNEDAPIMDDAHYSIYCKCKDDVRKKYGIPDYYPER